MCFSQITARSKIMKFNEIKNALFDSINALDQCKWMFVNDPTRDFTHQRKLTFKETLSAILSFNNGTLNHELMDHFGFDADIATSSAFI